MVGNDTLTLGTFKKMTVNSVKNLDHQHMLRVLNFIRCNFVHKIL